MFLLILNNLKKIMGSFAIVYKMVFKTRRNAMAVLEVKELTKKYGESGQFLSL